MPAAVREGSPSAVGRSEKELSAMVEDHGPQIKDDEQYEALRKQGMSKEKAARIANTDRHQAAVKGGKAAKYEDWSRQDLYEKAREVGIGGRSKMKKEELIDALRHH
jgi:hypothetical protein